MELFPHKLIIIVYIIMRLHTCFVLTICSYSSKELFSFGYSEYTEYIIFYSIGKITLYSVAIKVLGVTWMETRAQQMKLTWPLYKTLMSMHLLEPGCGSKRSQRMFGLVSCHKPYVSCLVVVYVNYYLLMFMSNSRLFLIPASIHLYQSLLVLDVYLTLVSVC